MPTLLAFWREAAELLGQPGPDAAPLPDLPADAVRAVRSAAGPAILNLGVDVVAALFTGLPSAFEPSGLMAERMEGPVHGPGHAGRVLASRGLGRDRLA